MSNGHYVKNTETTTQDISQEIKLGRRWFFQMDNDSKNTTYLATQCIKVNKDHVLKWPSHRPDLRFMENL